MNKKLWKKFQESGGKYDLSRPLTDKIRERRDKTAQALGFSEAKKLQSSILPHWRLHDLRRTAATGMAGLKVPPHVVERVINHLSGVQGGMTGVYQHHEYRDERIPIFVKGFEKAPTLAPGFGEDGARG